MKKLILVLVLLFTMTGCTTYYEISDPDSQRTYYTTSVKRLGSGSIRIQDAKSGSEVTLQSSQISKISKEEYNTKLYRDKDRGNNEVKNKNKSKDK